MCSLFVLLDADPDFPILVAANRDEQRARPSSPPGLFVGRHRRILSPRDQRAHGTWMGVNDALWFAGLTNVAGGNRSAAAASRGALPHLALDQEHFDAVPKAIAAEVVARAYNDFQLLVTDGTRAVVLRHVDRALCVETPSTRTFVLTNEHAPQTLQVPGLDGARAHRLSVLERLDRLAPLLLDTGASSGHRVLKVGGDYGTVSSSLVAIPRRDVMQLIWRFAPGSPEQTSYRNYGNLGRRLRG